MLTSISLFAFRNYLRETVPLVPGTNLFLGANAQGKTNLVEAIYLAATGRSPRSAVLAEMVMWRQVGARVVLDYEDHEAGHRVEIRLEREPDSRRTKRTATLDGRPISATGIAGRRSISPLRNRVNCSGSSTRS